MAYVVYEIESTRILKAASGKEYFATERAAKSALTRAVKADGLDRAKYAIADLHVFNDTIEKMVEVTNLMTGAKVMESVNTPYYLSVASESYWSA